MRVLGSNRNKRLCCYVVSQKQTVPKSKVKRYLTTTVCVLICLDALWIEGYFLLAILFYIFSYNHSGQERRAGTCVLQVDSLVSISLCAISRGFVQLQAISEQTNTPIVYTNITPNMQCLPPSARETVGGVTAGYKNAYSSLWLVHKLAAGRLGLGLGRGPGPELAQLLAAMLSLPQPQPHCAKLLHTYNLLIMHEVFKGVKKVYCRTKESVEN